MQYIEVVVKENQKQNNSKETIFIDSLDGKSKDFKLNEKQILSFDLTKKDISLLDKKR